ncbi:hypothetical protein SAMN04488070_0312 [Pseudidiomarina maritima]|nr:hypothetical protein [Pseudidiomarina maritima]SFR38632.1 hypothetical protein SAMN04488070_0312 [Pseudidiomarina maritima]
MAGCSDLSPSCDAALAKREIRQFVMTQLPGHVEFKSMGITTLRTNFATGEVLCSAKVTLQDAYLNNEVSRAVGYTVKYDKQHQFKITVF